MYLGVCWFCEIKLIKLNWLDSELLHATRVAYWARLLHFNEGWKKDIVVAFINRSSAAVNTIHNHLTLD